VKAGGFPYKTFKPIAQLTLNGALIRKFKSITEAQIITGFNYMGISNCAKGIRETYKGFMWQFVYN